MTVIVAFLRGINVGGRNKIRMTDLRELFQSLHINDVTTHLQSGNVVFRSEELDLDNLAVLIESGLLEKFGSEIGVIFRTIEELRNVVAGQPFTPDQLAEPSKALVTFFDNIPTETAITALIENYKGAEQFHFSGHEMYTYYVDGIGRSRLTLAYVEKKLNVTGTSRNWNTINKLLEMANGLER